MESIFKNQQFPKDDRIPVYKECPNKGGCFCPGTCREIIRYVEPNKGGFFDLPEGKKRCNHPSHEPPSHIYIPPGKGYTHVCPGCGKSTDLIPPQITL